MLATSTPDRDEVAFAVQMKAVQTSEVTEPRESPVRPPATEGSQPTTIPIQEADAPAPEPASENRYSLPDRPEHTPLHAERERRPEATSGELTESPTGPPANKIIPHASLDAQVKAETAPERTGTNAAKTVRPQDVMESEIKPEAAKATSVRDVKFEVTGGERRVEVRLSEQGGELKMTVRTPDNHLASTLRENLPELSARLAESGFKSEAWHPAASSTNEWRHTTESSAGAASQDGNQDANSQSRQQDREPQDDAGQRHPKGPQEPTSQKEKGKNFAWLMSSLR
jgi:hypothetical protein